MTISKSPLRTRQPDLLYISKERLEELVKEQVHGGPDLVVEIVSPGNTTKHIQQELRDYAAAGVREAWVVHPKRRSIAVLHPQKGELRETAVFEASQRLRSQTVPGLAFLVRKIFA